ncbi:MAG: hypothetical protein M1834_004360 [Cirrosporium novae-zelandiae]|nr:MAG: hypothetical protein M1834_004360 [Cirrosporium novae-zelandiae]
MPPKTDIEENDEEYEDRTASTDSEGDDNPDAQSHLLHYRSASEEQPDRHLPLPVWMREASETVKLKWMPKKLRNAAQYVVDWVAGPDPHQTLSIKPCFPGIQEAPIRLMDRYLPKRKYKIVLLLAFYVSWLLTWGLILHASTSAGDIEGYGKPTSIWCGASYWSNGNECGLNGNGCRPFDNATFAFRCSAECNSLKVLSPHAVGNQEVVYSPLVIGGLPPNGDANNAIYRGDSFICQAAIHAGVITNEKGGCGVVELAGHHSQFPGSQSHGIKSTSFDSDFPKSFRFKSGVKATCSKDLRWPLLAVTVTYTTILSLFTTSPSVFFCSIFVMLFFHVGLVSDPPNYPDLTSLFSLILGRFLPAAFVGYVIYRYCVRRSLKGLTAQFEKTIFWLGGAWVGALSNYTFDFLPIQRLTPHDLAAQPGAYLTLIIIVVLITAIACGQIYHLRLEGRLPRYLLLYGLFVLTLVIGIMLPRLNLRIHHYILALLLLPGTSIQTRLSLLYQGLLVGLLINGIARWGFASMLETTWALLGDQADWEHAPLPNITTVIATTQSIALKWPLPPWPYDGVSVLVNDVERWRGFVQESIDQDAFFGDGWTHTRMNDAEKEYLRFAYIKGNGAGPFTKAGVWEINGTWVPMKPGRS